MTHSTTAHHEAYPDEHHDSYSKTIFGFWIYLLTDFMMFATIFATYAVLSNSTFGGPSGKQLFYLPYTLVQTLVLLTAAFTSGIGGIFAHRRNIGKTVTGFSLTFLLGLVFMWMEYSEFARIIMSGNTWQKSAYLSAYFTIVAMHGIHVIFGLIWIPVLMIPLVRYGISVESIKRLTCLRMFWQFLSVVWVFIFAIVYLLGVS